MNLSRRCAIALSTFLPTSILLSPSATPAAAFTRSSAFSSSSRLSSSVRHSMSSSTADKKDAEYAPPEVWKWEAKDDGNKFASINRPTAGAQRDLELPVGDHPLQLYSLATPNGVKVTVMLEELLAAGKVDAEYDAWAVKIFEGDQFGSGFVSVNPNSKIPALMDRSDASKPQRVFESGSILLYLSEKFDNAFVPADPSLRTECLSWLFWQMGSAPYLGGGFGHFFSYAPYKMEYPINRFTMEAKRQLDVLNNQLQDGRTYLLGDDYTIADIAIWPWYGQLVLGNLYEGSAKFLNVDEDYPHVMKWAQRVADRPAVKRGVVVNKVWGDGPQLADRHAAADIDTVMAEAE